MTNRHISLAVDFRSYYLMSAVKTTFWANMMLSYKIAAISASYEMWCFKMHIDTTASACASF